MTRRTRFSSSPIVSIGKVRMHASAHFSGPPQPACLVLPSAFASPIKPLFDEKSCQAAEDRTGEGADDFENLYGLCGHQAVSLPMNMVIQSHADRVDKQEPQRCARA